MASTMASNAGMEMGNSNSGSMISRLRVRKDMAAKNVPFTTNAHVPKRRHNGQLVCGTKRAQVVKHDKERRHQRLQHGNEDEIPDDLGQEQRVGGAGETR